MHTVAMTSPPFRVETVPVRRGGRLPMAIAGLVVALVAVAIAKPWAGADQAQPDQAPASALLVAVDAPKPTSLPPGAADAAEAIVAAKRAQLAAGQVECGSSDWRIVTLGDFVGWTARTWIAITPVEAAGPGDASIPDLWLGESDIAGLGACAPSASPGAVGRASRIVAAWRQSADGTGTAAFGRVTLAELDPLPSGGPAGTRSPAPRSVTELFRPVPAAPRGRWPAGRYVLLLASPDPDSGRWIAVDIGGAGK